MAPTNGAEGEPRPAEAEPKKPWFCTMLRFEVVHVALATLGAERAAVARD